MKTEKWVRCTEELALNPERVKAWRLNIDQREVRFIAYDKGHEMPLIFRGNVSPFCAELDSVECLIEVPIQERFLTFYEDSTWFGGIYTSESEAKGCKTIDCTHIVKLTFDGQKFQVECVWKKA